MEKEKILAYERRNLILILIIRKKVLHTNNKIKNFNVNKGDNIKVDYLPTKIYKKLQEPY